MKRTFNLEVRMDNSAFEHNSGELSRILTEQLLPKISPLDGWVAGKLKDINGNSVGEWKITEEMVELTPDTLHTMFAGRGTWIEQKEESYIGEYDMDCPECNHSITGQGVLATGIQIKSTGYKPAPGELLKNKFIECPHCGWNQAS
jgi:hypothetical protein